VIQFEFNGRPFDPKNFEGQLLRAAMEAVAAQVRERLGAIRHPETGEFSTVVVMGTNANDLQFRIEGSPELLAMVRERLGQSAEGDPPMVGVEAETAPRAFLCYAFEDRELASKTARTLQTNGIDTWWDKWCVDPA
jgi:hypothetical protein